MAYKIPITCNHLYVNGTYTNFPCQINLSFILLEYPDIKDAISIASDINVMDSENNYLSVYIDLDKTNDKLLIYFSGIIDNVSDKTFYVTVGYDSSVNSFLVFSNYFERAWGLNGIIPTAPSDACLASGELLYRGSTTFGIDTLFYKGARALTGHGYTSPPACINGTSSFIAHVQCSKVDGPTTGSGHYFTYVPGLNQVMWFRQTTSNTLEFRLQKAYSVFRVAYISTALWDIGDFYDIVLVVDLSKPTDAEKVKFYVNGYQVSVSFNAPWSIYTTTVSGPIDFFAIGYMGNNNASIVDFLGFTSEQFTDDFILTSANQYLNSDFWSIYSEEQSFVVNKQYNFVNKKIYFKSLINGTNFLWKFGDGSTSNIKNVKHIYTKPGIYTVELDIDGTVYIKNNYIIIIESSFISNSGVIYLNYGELNQVIFGATKGGVLFGIDQNFRYMTFDGQKGNIKSKRLLEVYPKIIANFVEINYRLLNIALPGSNISFKSDKNIITKAIKNLLNNNYIKNIAIIVEHGFNGSYIIFKILNAISVENLEINLQDNNETVIEITFIGCFSTSDMEKEPWEIDFVNIE